MSKHTPGPWVARAMGGSSVVLAPTKPERNDTRIPAYGYAVENGHSIGYPFIDDEYSKGVRLDFVCFSHADAKLIAAAPELLEVLREMTPAFNTTRMLMDAKESRDHVGEIVARARTAIAKATT